MYAKVIKYVSWALILVSVALIVLGFVLGFESREGLCTDLLIFWAYAMVGVAVGAIVIAGLAIAAVNNPKSLLKVLAGAVVVCGAIYGIYALSAGAPAVGLIGKQPGVTELKVADTILTITYITLAGSILSIIVGAVVNAIRK